MAAPSEEVIASAREQGLVADRLSHTIDRDTYTPALLGLLNNMLVWSGARLFQHAHGVGTNEWRIISALANHPGSTASDLCEVLGLNKSIASKSVAELVSRGFVAQLVGPRASRHLFLTQDGERVHDDLMPIARERERILQASLSPDEVAQLNALLVRMLEAEDALTRYEKDITG
ncbi:hypothetical protein GCM10009808_19260 [Microbacterium sediminicola]|uniref:HTH marR-type domain-containing protein n=1 Tax=Microbacterium sediminicola TaxID=415210 RepID=A0ABP4UB13_9MICO